jgi:S-adenosyl-L-methionine hydrolase (adenosine-forming)
MTTSLFPVAFLSDYGHTDPYVGIVKGVLAAQAPGVPVIDLLHEVAPGDVERAARVLADSVAYFPAGTVFLAVVDPGVGTARRGMAATAHFGDGPRHIVCPDNGTLTLIARRAHSMEYVHLDKPPFAFEQGDTFHGRDLFAPVAARLATGTKLAELGVVLTDPVTLPLPVPERDETEIIGRIIHIDRFGNCVTDVPGVWVFNAVHGPFPVAECDWQLSTGLIESDLVGLTFGHLPENAIGFIPGSTGNVEIVLNGANAARLLSREAFAGESPLGQTVIFRRYARIFDAE